MSERNHADYIPLYRLLESLGGSEAYEKDPEAYAEGLISGWPKELPRDSKDATDLFNLLQKPINHGNGVTLTMLEFLRGVEKLGGAKSYEEFVHKPAELASNQSDKDLKLFDRKADATLRGGSVIFYTFFSIIADIDNFEWTFTGYAWGPGGSAFNGLGDLNYFSYRGTRPDLTSYEGKCFVGLAGIARADTYDQNGKQNSSFIGLGALGVGMGWGYGSWSYKITS